MKDTKTYQEQIKQEIAETIKSYADEPDEFFNKMHKLVSKWFCKGIHIGIQIKNGTEKEIKECET